MPPRRFSSSEGRRPFSSAGSVPKHPPLRPPVLSSRPPRPRSKRRRRKPPPRKPPPRKPRRSRLPKLRQQPLKR
ncbi:hypothetical protein DL237_13740 [Pseudooceanicola sediminis]|uniref:Uncharacterized protein n=1 Tax=Pseudooceanicola sediminis TaxID=2211117 RepID=A0A399IXT9_9RHOB|nr:hypothetical protein E0K93_16325 [Puniceibacterium sp. HSS470]RII38003.1 hypothetical protein DL237_13740 [Pseudooceanicola sediminis]